MNIKILPAYDSPREVCDLFAEYTDMLIQKDPQLSSILKFRTMMKS